jgi:subtilisin-like proprotein convertase family protein
MKRILTLVAVLMLAKCAVGQPYVLSSNLTVNAVIPDNNPSGYASTMTVSGMAAAIQNVTVTLDITGGYNGDLYAYVTYDGQLLTLLNRVGQRTGSNPTYTFGYSDAGLDVTLADGASNGDIHDYQNVGGYGGLIGSGGTFMPDSTGVATFADTYGGLVGNGTWSLFLADLSAGNQSTLASWSLDISTVPEPSALTLGALGVGIIGIRAFKRRK